MLLIEYPKCSTCQKANKYLKSKNFKYKFRNIVIDKLNVNELDRLIQKSGKDINKFFVNDWKTIYNNLEKEKKLALWNSVIENITIDEDLNITLVFRS